MKKKAQVGLFVFYALTIPNLAGAFDTDAYCEQVSNAAGGSYQIEKTCHEQEHEAQSNISIMTIPQKIKNYCKNVGQTAGGSYQIMESCIEQELNAKSELSNVKEKDRASDKSNLSSILLGDTVAKVIAVTGVCGERDLSLKLYRSTVDRFVIDSKLEGQNKEQWTAEINKFSDKVRTYISNAFEGKEEAILYKELCELNISTAKKFMAMNDESLKKLTPYVNN